MKVMVEKRNWPPGGRVCVGKSGNFAKCKFGPKFEGVYNRSSWEGGLAGGVCPRGVGLRRVGWVGGPRTGMDPIFGPTLVE